MPRKKADRSVTCWGWGGKGCDAKIPDTDPKTMVAYGWGFLQDLDPGAPANNDGSTGLGAYFACPSHRTDNLADDDASAGPFTTDEVE